MQGWQLCPKSINNMCKVFSLVGQLVVCVAYLREKAFGSDAVHKNYKVKPEISDAVLQTKITSSVVLRLLSNEFSQSRVVKHVPWMVGIASMRRWGEHLWAPTRAWFRCCGWGERSRAYGWGL